MIFFSFFSRRPLRRVFYSLPCDEPVDNKSKHAQHDPYQQGPIPLPLFLNPPLSNRMTLVQPQVGAMFAFAVLAFFVHADPDTVIPELIQDVQTGTAHQEASAMMQQKGADAWSAQTRTFDRVQCRAEVAHATDSSCGFPAKVWQTLRRRPSRTLSRSSKTR